MTEKPLWLESAEIQALLNRLLDGLERAEQNGSVSARPLALGEQAWPALYLAPVESRKEELWEHVGEMCGWGWLEVIPASAAAKVAGYDQKPKLRVRDEAQLRAAASRPTRIKSSAQQWKDAVFHCLDATEEVKAVVAAYCIDIPDRPMEEVVQRLNQLPGFGDRSLLLREVSARLFWGMSKLLDKRQALVAAMLHVDECPFPASPIQLQVYLPRRCTSILFIENQMSFERAIRSTSGIFEDMALVFASGFKGSAQRLRKVDTCSLFYSNKGAREGETIDRFEGWLFANERSDATPVWFWGDLDYAGMRILAAMRSSFSEIAAWPAGYGPMLNELHEGRGHSPEAADKSGQQSIVRTGCSYADQVLIPAIGAKRKFIDQETFNL
jgi:hypothetical protein